MAVLSKNNKSGNSLLNLSGYVRQNNTCIADRSVSKMNLMFCYHNKIVSFESFLATYSKLNLVTLFYQVVMDPTGKTVRQLTNASDASGLDFHKKKGFIFFTDIEQRR